MTDPAVTIALIAAGPGILGGMFAGWSSLKQRGQENLTLTITSMQQHMATLSTENKDLRAEVSRTMDRERANAVALAKCEGDKEMLSQRLSDLERRLQ